MFATTLQFNIIISLSILWCSLFLYCSLRRHLILWCCITCIVKCCSVGISYHILRMNKLTMRFILRMKMKQIVIICDLEYISDFHLLSSSYTMLITRWCWLLVARCSATASSLWLSIVVFVWLPTSHERRPTISTWLPISRIVTSYFHLYWNINY